MREFLVYIHETGASYHVLRNYVSALRFLYRITLRKPWTPEDIPFPRQPKHLPSIPTKLPTGTGTRGSSRAARQIVGLVRRNGGTMARKCPADGAGRGQMGNVR